MQPVSTRGVQVAEQSGVSLQNVCSSFEHSVTLLNCGISVWFRAIYEVDYRTFRSLQRNWLSKKSKMITRSLFFELFIPWLPVQARIDYKLSTVCHSFFADSSPASLSYLLTVCTPSRQLYVFLLQPPGLSHPRCIHYVRPCVCAVSYTHLTLPTRMVV